ncbi:MAG TPA: hypothetical protein VF829_03095 [Candidatus Paceibacterota bacterium]
MKRFWFFAVIALAMASLSMGCAAALGDNPNKFDADECLIKLKKPIAATDFIEKTRTVGEHLGYGVKNVNRETNTVTFARTDASVIGYWIGKGDATTEVTAQLLDTRKAIAVNIQKKGCIGDPVQKVRDGFREGLARQFDGT